MKKLLVIALMLFLISIVANAKKTDRVFIKLTRTMLVVKPVKTIKHQGTVVSYWKIKNGAFYYLTSRQEFRGKYKTCNFVTTRNKTIISGVTKKQKRHIKRKLLSDIRSSQY